MFGSTIGREVRYSWTYLLQRPMVQNPGITNYTVCVYNRRPVAGTLEFTLPSATINITDSSISFIASDPTTVKPILPGQWVLDATLAKSIGPQGANSTGVLPANQVVPMANFYRIINVRSGATNETILDLQTPIRGYDKILNAASDTDTGLPSGKLKYPKSGTASVATLVIQDGLVEAIDVGPALARGFDHEILLIGELPANLEPRRRTPRCCSTGCCSMGFTLIELMVAMALSMFLMAILSEAFAVSMDTFRGLRSIGDMQDYRSATVSARCATISPPRISRGPARSATPASGWSLAAKASST